MATYLETRPEPLRRQSFHLDPSERRKNDTSLNMNGCKHLLLNIFIKTLPSSDFGGLVRNLETIFKSSRSTEAEG